MDTQDKIKHFGLRHIHETIEHNCVRGLEYLNIISIMANELLNVLGKVTLEYFKLTTVGPIICTKDFKRD